MKGRPGRPPLDPDDPSTTVHVRLPSRRYDELYQLAARAQTSVPAIIRQLIARDRRDDDGDEDE